MLSALGPTLMSSNHAILFDLDQTLLNRQASLVDFCQWQASFQLKLPPDVATQFVYHFIELDNNGSVWKDQVYAKLISIFQLKSSIDELLLSYVEQFQFFCRAFPNVSECIKQLHQHGYQIGLISNGKSPFQEQNFRQLGLSHYFSSIVVSEAVQCRKPDPKIFALACEQLKCPPAQCIFIGDNEVADIQGALQAGLRSIRFYPPTSLDSSAAAQRHTMANATFDDFSQLAKLIHAL